MSQIAARNQLQLGPWVRRFLEHYLNDWEALLALPPIDLDNPPPVRGADRYPMGKEPPDRRIYCRFTLLTKRRLDRLAACHHRPLSAWLRHTLADSLDGLEGRRGFPPLPGQVRGQNRQ